MMCNKPPDESEVHRKHHQSHLHSDLVEKAAKEPAAINTIFRTKLLSSFSRAGRGWVSINLLFYKFKWYIKKSCKQNIKKNQLKYRNKVFTVDRRQIEQMLTFSLCSKMTPDCDLTGSHHQVTPNFHIMFVEDNAHKYAVFF